MLLKQLHEAKSLHPAAEMALLAEVLEKEASLTTSFFETLSTQLDLHKLLLIGCLSHNKWAKTGVSKRSDPSDELHFMAFSQHLASDQAGSLRVSRAGTAPAQSLAALAKDGAN